MTALHHHLLLAVGIGALLSGCATPTIKALEPGAVRDSYLPFLKDGRTTREQVLLKLGAPSAQFEGGRILTYAFRLDDDDRLQVLMRHMHTSSSQWRPGMYSLVVVFRANGVLARHSLVVGQ